MATHHRARTARSASRALSAPIAGGKYTPCQECYEAMTRRPDKICWECHRGWLRKNAIVDRYEVNTYIRFPLPKGTKVECAGKEKQFLKPNAGQKERDLCRKCPAYEWCLEWGIENDEWGTWGGLSQSERRQVKAGQAGRRDTLTRADYTLVA